LFIGLRLIRFKLLEQKARSNLHVKYRCRGLQEITTRITIYKIRRFPVHAMVTAIGCIKVGLDFTIEGIELIRLGAEPLKGGSEMFPFTGIFVNNSKKNGFNR
jgi:hypothetical protein